MKVYKQITSILSSEATQKDINKYPSYYQHQNTQWISQHANQLLSKYPNTNLVDIVNLCKDIVSMKSCRHPKKTVIYDSERVKSMRKRKRVKKYYNITKEELILALQNKQGENPEIPQSQPQPQQADGKTPFFKK